MKAKLEKIINKYSEKEYNADNYYVGGGLDGCKFASNRHEDALNDAGKLTLGKANQLFATATGLTVDEVSEVIKYAIPFMEWHHAGKLPKSYGGGMKKTYFLNASEIVKVATNWESYYEKFAIQKEEKRTKLQNENTLQARKLEYLNANAKSVSRVSKMPTFFYETNREMDGKYGWFCSYGKSYNMTEYYSGWEFASEEKYNEFLNIK